MIFDLFQMGRVYHRKTNKGAYSGSYTREDLNKAVLEVKEGENTLRGSSKKYSVPRTTLRHYVNCNRGQGSVACKGKVGGGKPALPKKDQDNLAELIKCMEQMKKAKKEEKLTSKLTHSLKKKKN